MTDKIDAVIAHRRPAENLLANEMCPLCLAKAEIDRLNDVINDRLMEIDHRLRRLEGDDR